MPFTDIEDSPAPRIKKVKIEKKQDEEKPKPIKTNMKLRSKLKTMKTNAVTFMSDLEETPWPKWEKTIMYNGMAKIEHSLDKIEKRIEKNTAKRIPHIADKE